MNERSKRVLAVTYYLARGQVETPVSFEAIAKCLRELRIMAMTEAEFAAWGEQMLQEVEAERRSQCSTN